MPPWLASSLNAFARGVCGLSPSCQEAARLQSLALDRPLRPSERLGLRIHLALCKWCRAYGSQIQFLNTAAKSSDQHLPAQSLSPEARERLRRALRDPS